MSAWSDRQAARSSLKCWYRFGEPSGTTLVDSATGPDGTYAGTGVALGAPSLIGDDADTAVTFNGTADVATVPDDAALDLADVFTLKFMIKRHGLGTNQTVANKTGATPSWRILFNTNNKVALHITAIVATSDAQIADTTARHHIAITKNGSTTKIYVDGVEGTLAGTNAANTNTANVLRIGHLLGGTQRLNATLDEFTIDNVDLDAAYIAEDAAVAFRMTGVAALNGEMTLTAAGLRALAGSAALDGALDLTAAGFQASLGAASLEGSLDLQALGTAWMRGTAVLEGESALVAAGYRVVAGAAALEGSLDLQAVGSALLSGASSLAGVLDLQAAGVAALTGAGSLEGSLALQAVGHMAACGSSSLAGELALQAVGSALLAGVAALSGDSDMQAVGKSILRGASALSGDASLSAAGVRALTGTAALEGALNLQAAGGAQQYGAADLAGALTLTAVGVRALLGSAALDGSLSLQAVGNAILAGAASLSGELVMSLPIKVGRVEAQGGIDLSESGPSGSVLVESSGAVRSAA